jgi:hypothetical protein
MPGNSLALAIRVGCEEDLACVLGLLLDLLDDVALAADVDVVRAKLFSMSTPSVLLGRSRT